MWVKFLAQGNNSNTEVATPGIEPTTFRLVDWCSDYLVKLAQTHIRTCTHARTQAHTYTNIHTHLHKVARASSRNMLNMSVRDRCRVAPAVKLEMEKLLGILLSSSRLLSTEALTSSDIFCRILLSRNPFKQSSMELHRNVQEGIHIL